MENHEFPKAAAIMAQHDPGPEYARIECVICGRKTRIEESKDMSDAELTSRFERRGWTVSPTRCPNHVGMQ